MHALVEQVVERTLNNILLVVGRHDGSAKGRRSPQLGDASMYAVDDSHDAASRRRRLSDESRRRAEYNRQSLSEFLQASVAVFDEGRCPQ